MALVRTGQAEHRGVAMSIAVERDEIGVSRDRAGDLRDAAGDRRDVVGIERDVAADLRDRRADARDRSADRRDTLAERRDAAAEYRERGAHSDLPALVDRRAAAADRRRASQDRRAGARERSEAGRDRAVALADRGAGATERVTSGEDRTTSHAHRGASADDRAAFAIDSLTGVYLRGAGSNELDRRISVANESGEALVVVFVDVDHLKAVNDASGHGAGDRVLTEVAATLRSSLRPQDLILRYGGDEFVCAIAGLSVPEVVLRFSEIAQSLADGAERSSVSVGVAALKPGDSAEQVVSRADSALYLARRNQRGEERPSSAPAAS